MWLLANSRRHSCIYGDRCVNATWTVGLPAQERNGPTTAPTFFRTSRLPSLPPPPTTTIATTTTTAPCHRYVNHYRAVFGYGRGGDKPCSVIVACCITQYCFVVILCFYFSHLHVRRATKSRRTTRFGRTSRPVRSIGPVRRKLRAAND